MPRSKSQKDTAVVVLITASTEKEARAIADCLLTKRKAACVNIVPKVDSSFWWQDKIDTAQESLLLVKTKASLVPQIITLVKGIHSYQVPEIIALPVIAGNPDYLEWIDKEVRESFS
ncbi:MAG: divalent-cation tolerance protein CutA [Chloroflexota bacterium]